MGEIIDSNTMAVISHQVSSVNIDEVEIQTVSDKVLGRDIYETTFKCDKDNDIDKIELFSATPICTQITEFLR